MQQYTSENVSLRESPEKTPTENLRKEDEEEEEVDTSKFEEEKQQEHCGFS